MIWIGYYNFLVTFSLGFVKHFQNVFITLINDFQNVLKRLIQGFQNVGRG